MSEKRKDWKAALWASDMESYQRWTDLLAEMRTPAVRKRIQKTIANQVARMTERYGKSATKGL